MQIAVFFREALSHSESVTGLIDELWNMSRVPLPVAIGRLLRSFLEVKAPSVVAAANHASVVKTPSSEDAPLLPRLTKVRSAAATMGCGPSHYSVRSGLQDATPSLQPLSASDIAATVSRLLSLWEDGIVTRQIYDITHRRFLVALAALGTAVASNEVGHSSLLHQRHVASTPLRISG